MQQNLHGPSTRQALASLEMRMMSSLVPSLGHRDDVERLRGLQGVAYVTKLLNMDEALGTESGQRESAKEYLKVREKNGAAAGGP